MSNCAVEHSNCGSHLWWLYNSRSFFSILYIVKR